MHYAGKASPQGFGIAANCAGPWASPMTPAPIAGSGHRPSPIGPRRRGTGMIAVASVIAPLALTACGLHISIGSIGHAGPSRSESKVARAIDPRLVDVVSVLRYQDASAAGTGIVLTSRGEVLTNNHVIRGATSIRVIDVGNGRSYRATVVGYDEKDDIAVL